MLFNLNIIHVQIKCNQFGSILSFHLLLLLISKLYFTNYYVEDSCFTLQENALLMAENLRQTRYAANFWRISGRKQTQSEPNRDRKKLFAMTYKVNVFFVFL